MFGACLWIASSHGAFLVTSPCLCMGALWLVQGMAEGVEEHRLHGTDTSTDSATMWGVVTVVAAAAAMTTMTTVMTMTMTTAMAKMPPMCRPLGGQGAATAVAGTATCASLGLLCALSKWKACGSLAMWRGVSI